MRAATSPKAQVSSPIRSTILYCTNWKQRTMEDSLLENVQLKLSSSKLRNEGLAELDAMSRSAPLRVMAMGVSE